MSDGTVDLNIKKVFSLFYSNIWVVLFIIMFSVTIGFLIYKTSDDKWSGEIKVSKIDFKEKTKYDEMILGLDTIGTRLILNRLPYLEVIKEGDIDDMFLKFFFDEINDRQEIVKYFRDNKIFDSNNYSPIEYEEILREASHSIQLISEYSEDEKISFRMLYSSNSISQIKELFEYVLILANRNVAENFKNIIDSRKMLAKKLIETKFVEINKEINLISDNYNDELENRILFLNEQYQIARSINVENNQLTQGIILDELKTDDNAFMPPYYLRGYKAIEKELELIKKRIQNNVLPDSVLIKKSDLRNLDLLSENLNYFDLYNATPLVNDNFKSTNYDIGSIEYLNSKLSLIYHLIISFAISLILASVYIFIIWLKDND